LVVSKKFRGPDINIILSSLGKGKKLLIWTAFKGATGPNQFPSLLFSIIKLRFNFLYYTNQFSYSSKQKSL
jgi:hypothetical protein